MLKSQKLTSFLFVFILHSGQFAHTAKVAVIGAGLSGLTAAYRLKQSGLFVDGSHQVEVFEARERVGGRVFSILVKGAVEEVGGANINDGDEAKHFVNLAHELGLAIHRYESRSGISFYDASQENAHNFYADPAFQHTTDLALSKLHDLSISKQSLNEVMDEFFVNQPLIRRVYESRVRSYEGSETRFLSATYAQTSLKGMLEWSNEVWTQYLNNQPSFYEVRHVEGGNARLPLLLASELGDDVHLNTPLRKISRSDEGYKLEFDKNVTVHADIVVLTVPCSVLSDIQFEEGVIPHSQLKAMQSVAYGRIAKILVPVNVDEQSFGVVLSDDLLTWFDEGRRVMTYYYAGEGAVANAANELTHFLQRDSMAVKKAFSDVEFLGGNQVERPKARHFSSYDGPVGLSWATEPYTKGGYSNRAPRADALLQGRSEKFGEPVVETFMPVRDTLFFAGEHSAITDPSTMEGAIESGERTARMVLKSLEKNKVSFEKRAEL